MEIIKMLKIRKPKQKMMTIQPEKPILKSYRRQISEGITVNDFESHENPHQNLKKFPEIPELKLEKSAIKKKIDILDELGFGSHLQSKAEGNYEEKKLLKRRFSIGITDFWTGQDREKFLREKGYLDVYKKLQAETLNSELKKATSIRRPELPHIMDSNAKRRASAYVEETNPYLTSRAAKRKIDFPQLSTRHSDKDWLGPIEKLMGKCNDLAKDTFQLRFKTEQLKYKLRQELNPKKKPKISLNDKKRINSIVNSMAL
jgi:hypothetical protein